MPFWKLDKPLLWISVIIMHIVVVSLANIQAELAWAGYIVGLLIYGVSYVATFKRGYRWWD